MKIHKIFFPALILITGLAMNMGCEKEIPFDAEVKERKIVVNSLFQPDSIWAVKVGYSLSVIDQGYPGLLDGATVEVFDEGGTRIDSLEMGIDQVYRSPSGLRPQAGARYTIRASKAGFETVSSSNYCPSPVSIISWDTAKVSSPDGYDEMEITVTIADPSTEENYYGLVVTASAVEVYGTDTSYYSFNVQMYSNDPIVEQGVETVPGERPFFNELLFVDKHFSGQTYTMKFSVDYFVFAEIWADYAVSLKLYSCTEEFFRYLISYNAYQNTYGNPFAQPVQVFSNVEGGFGIFAGASTDTKVVTP